MSVKRWNNGKWRATVYLGGRQYTRHFDTKRAAEEWETRERESVQRGAWIDPDKRKITVSEWADRWLEGYAVNRASTVRQARTHLRRINAEFGTMRLQDVSPTDVKVWVSQMQTEGLADSTAYAHHRRLAQLFNDAIHEGLVTKSPTSRRTSPKPGKQRPYVASTEAVWALFDAMPADLRAAVLLGAFAGLRAGEIVAMTTRDIDFMRGIVTVRVGYSEGDFAAPLKTASSAASIPLPLGIMADLGRIPSQRGTEYLVVSEWGKPITPARLDVHFRRATKQVPALPEGFRLHDLRHYYASVLIAAGLDIKTLQARMRHASAKVTLDVYGHMFPDRDESTRAALEAAVRPAAITPAPVVPIQEARRRHG